MLENIEQKIVQVEISKEMKKSYLDYSMSVILGRALPDVRDGLKPVHRRIMYAMYEDHLTPDRPYRKCATTVGNVLGRYHPHGDAAVYDTIVRMAQDFSLRYPLIDGHGNFGSVDGDAPAAYRYTEARMSKLAVEMLKDIEKETVDFTANFDENLQEPTVLPAKFPNLLVNGSVGIAVGMATNMPPHNITEVINATVAVIDDGEITIDELMEHIKGPDFPTYGYIMGKAGIREAYTTGRGKIYMRAKAEIEDWKDNRNRIIVTEIPYQVNKARLIISMADLVKDKRIEGISDIRDESDRDGMRIVIELKKDVNANVVLNLLYKYTSMHETFSIINRCVVDNKPVILNLRQIIDLFLKHQKDVIIRRTQFELKKAEERAHILEGLKKALDHIDRVIAIIRGSSNIPAARENLSSEFGFSNEQAQAIVQMALGRLTGLERDKIEEELAEITKNIIHLKEILASEALVFGIIKDELLVLRDKYGDERRTEIMAVADEINMEDLIEREDNVVTLTRLGYIKRLATNTYKAQKRGGKGVVGISTREEDFVETLFTASTHDILMFFTSKGRMYKLKAYQIPEASRQAKGTAIVNLLQLEAGEKVTAMIPVTMFEEDKYLLMATKNGVVKKTSLMEYSSTRKGGLNAIHLDDDDELIRVKITDGNCDIIIGTYLGKAIRFNEQDVRAMGRNARGVRGIRLSKDDYVVGVSYVREDSNLLIVTENGYGKRTKVDEFRVQARGGTGLNSYKLNQKTGKVAGIKTVTDSDDIMIITSDGTVIRIAATDINCYGRSAIGVRLMRLDEGVRVVSIARTEDKEEDGENTEDISEINTEENTEDILETNIDEKSEKNTEESSEENSGEIE